MLPKVIGASIEVIRVLHVDDDPNQFEFIKFFLNQVDQVLKVHCVGTPEEVIYELENNAYDCLVTDFQMPQMNGIELAKLVREKFSVPIILYTGQGSEEVAEAAFIVGIDDYLRKEMDPSHYQVLAKRIRHVVEKKQTEILYENVVEQARDAMCIFIKGKVVFANKSALDLFEIERRDEIIGSNPLLHNVDNNQSYFQQGLHDLVINKKNSGEKQYLELSTSPIAYNGKEAILCFIWDTTERRVLEIEKKISQERFRTLVELAPDGIATFNISGHVTFLNQAFCDLTGFTNEELLGKHITNLKTLRKRDLLKYIISFTKVLQGKTPQPMEFIYNKNNGTTGVGKAHIALVEVDGKKEMLLMASDITTRKKQETQFNQLLENTLDGIIEIDKDGVIKRINNSAISILEARKNQIIGNNILNVSFLDNKIKNDIRTIISKGTNHKKSKFIKCKLIRSDNKDIWGEICIHPITIDKERFGIQLFIRDSSRRKEVGLSETNFNTVAIETRYEDNPVTHNSHLFENNIIEQLHLAQNSINNIKINKSYNENLVNQLDDIFTQIINKLDKNTNHIETLLVEEVYSQLSDISNTQ